MVSSWKRYWFVLEGRLLLYYRSKDEYEGLSPCKGSISLGPTCKIAPSSTACVFQLEGRANTITLRAENRTEQERWMQAILCVLNQSTCSSNSRMNHFRYSSDDLTPTYILPKKYNSYEKLTEGNRKKENDLGDFLPRFLKTMSDPFSKNVGNVLYGNRVFLQSRISSGEELINDLYVVSSKKDNSSANQNKENFLRQKKNSDSAEDDTQDSRKHVANKKNSCDNLYERISQDSNFDNRQSNSMSVHSYAHVYELIEPINSNIRELEENDYSLPKEDVHYNKLETNLNKNSAIVDNHIYIEPIINNCDLEYEEYDCDVIDPRKEIKTLYEELDKCKRNIEQYKENEVAPKDNIKRKPTFKRITNYISKGEKGQGKYSFFNRILKKKKKLKENGGNNTCEEQTFSCLEQTVSQDEYNLDMLVELQAILEKKKIELEKKIKDQMVAQKSMEMNQENITKSVDEKCDNENTQAKIEENRKESKEECFEIKNTKEQEVIIRKKEPDTRDIKPLLPIKLRKSKVVSNENIQKETQSIDDILEDLDKENNPRKVKMLIEKFNDVCCSQVTLRDKNNSNGNCHIEDSNELNVLLEELAKVTSAPIMTPGVTSSLNTDLKSNEEWLRLMPIRYRRNSEPDYDIPRPLRKFQLLQRKSDVKEEKNKVGDFRESLRTIAPDSLEVVSTQECIKNVKETDLRETPINYRLKKSNSEVIQNFDSTEEIYARPRSILSGLKNNNQIINPIKTDKVLFQEHYRENNFIVNKIFNFPPYFNTVPKQEDGGIKSLDIFADSLEPYEETSTIF